MIVAQVLTDAKADDATIGIVLIEAVEGDLVSITADAAYDSVAVYRSAGAVARQRWFHRRRRRRCLDADL